MHWAYHLHEGQKTVLNRKDTLRPDQFNFREHGFFSKFEGSVGRKKKENKKNPQFFALALIINNNFLYGKPCIYSDFSKFASKKCVTMLKLTRL